MRVRSTAFFAAVIAVIPAIAVVLGSCGAPPQVDGPTTEPIHYFRTDPSPERNFLFCEMTSGDGDLTGVWNSELPPCRFDAGLTRPAPRGTLAYSEQSRLAVLLSDTGWANVSIQLRAYPKTTPDLTQTVRLSVNDSDLPERTVPNSPRTLVFPIPEGSLKVGENTIGLRFAHHTSALDAGIGKDQRPVAAIIERLWLTREGDAPGRGPEAREAAAKEAEAAGPRRIWDPAGQRLVARTRGTLILPIELLRGSDRLEIDVIPSADLDPTTSTVIFRLQNVDGTSSITREVSLSSVWPRRSPGPTTLEVPAGEFAGRAGLAFIELDPQPRGAFIALVPRVVEGRAPARGNPDDPPAPAPPTTSPPDIVVVILDATRSDHLSAHGYPRPTTPVIDRFAEQSLDFTNAFALAPYTLCSVPTMITGLSFVDHGVVGHKDTLSVSATTLAESLAEAGYRTAAFSTSPNNSVSKHFDQGYQEFHELWKEAPSPTSQDPHYLSQRVVDWLDGIEDERPLHLLVHFLPPHAPYAPAPAFNLFADPSYDGPCTGESASFDAIEAGIVPDRERCVSHLVDLYDGNLRAADDATGVLLEALERRERWRNTVVLITSDHGEAFLEHGRLTHNSTLYDEMLRVPFILRLPEDLEDLEVDTGRLVTLADLTPTLLAAAGIRFSGPEDAINLLAPPDAGTPSSGRYFVARNSAANPLLGLGTLRWKIMLTATGLDAIFDLPADPGERRNVRFENPREFVGLGLILTDRMTRAPTITAGSDRAHITQGDREILEALGYVDSDHDR